MNIPDFIRASLPTILDQWERFARDIPAATALPPEALRDHARGILLTIADDLEQAQSPAEEEQKSTAHGPPVPAPTEASRHGADRVLEGFSVNDAMSEYRALRASVVRLWVRQHAEAQTPACAELVRFNESIDQALTESLAGYTVDRERRNRLYDTLLSASPDLSFIVDGDGRLVYGNAALGAEFGEPLSALRGRRLSQHEGFVHEQFDEHVRLVSRSRRTVLGEISRRRRGENVTYEYLLVPVVDRDGRVEAVAGIGRNVTDRKAAEDKYRRRAQYDDLTGLPNRQLFRDRLSRELKRSDRARVPLALLFVDLDGFKQVNDLLGHEAGDELLRQGADRIRQCVRDTDTVARLGGDEFSVILTDLRNMQHLNFLAQQILDELSREFCIHGRSVLISASIGIALYPNDARVQDELLRHADQAMYNAKQSGRNRYSYFTADMRNAAALHVQRIAELREALAQRQLVVLYQPIVALDGGEVVGAEAQLFWRHHEHGALAAPAFTHLAAEAGLAADIDQLVVHDTLAQADAWRRLLHTPAFLSIERVSLPLSLKASEQPYDTIVEQMTRAGTPVALQVNESTLLTGAPAEAKLLHLLADTGVPVWLDGFGSDEAALACLTKLPLAGLRLDPELVHGIEAPAARALASGILAAAHALGVKVVADGMETPEQEAQLRALGCDFGQGLRFFAPMTAAEFVQLVEAAL